jgi:hypothetical protein
MLKWLLSQGKIGLIKNMGDGDLQHFAIVHLIAQLSGFRSSDKGYLKELAKRF